MSEDGSSKCSNQFWVIYPKYLLEYLCKSQLNACESSNLLRIANARLMNSAIHFQIREFAVLHKLWLLGYLPQNPSCILMQLTIKLGLAKERFQICEFGVLHKLCLKIALRSTASKFLAIYPKTFLNTYATPNQRLTKDCYASQLCFSFTSLAVKLSASTSDF